jgi:pimeloyl-ACP methyl ester carboxylesterase
VRSHAKTHHACDGAGASISDIRLRTFDGCNYLRGPERRELPDTTILLAQRVAAGALTLPAPLPSPGPRGGLTFVSAKDLPEFCRIAAVTRPSSDSEIKFEVWMPASNWNGKFMGLGNGAMAGSISYGSMAAALSRGYAASSTDTGHQGTGQDGSFALGHREKVIDFGYRAVHETTLRAKLMIAAYYGRAPKFSYWNGCSTGGRQALAEAQRFPADYNGIVYSPTVNPRTGEQIFPGMVPGSELGWSSNVGRMYADPPNIAKTLATAYLRYAVFQNPNWDYMTFDFDSGMALADRIDDGLTRATDPNLRDFFQLGGKLLQYHGWSDPSISPLNSINYYNSVLDFMGGPINVQASYRLFMVPGMDHCDEGDGPNTFDSIGAIDKWVEAGKAPEAIIATQLKESKVIRDRPLCPFPQVATYKGAGSIDEAANFVCALP